MQPTHLMRQVSIPKNIVETLNSLFDAHPAAIAELLTVSVATPRAADDPAVGDAELTLLVVINAVLDSVAPGKRIATIHGPDGFDGFVLGRDRKVAAPQPTRNTF